MTSDIFCSNSFVMKCLKRLINDNFPVFSFVFGSSHSVCYCPAVKLCLTLCNSMDCSTPGLLSFTISWHLLKFMSTESVMLSHPLLPPSPLAFNLSQHQGLFQWVSSSHQVAKVLEFQLQHPFFQWIFRIGSPLGLTDLIALLSKGLSRVFFSTTIRKHLLQCSAFFMIQLSYPHMTTGKNKFYYVTFVGKVISLLFNTLSRFVIAFHPRNNGLPISFSRPNIYCSGYTWDKDFSSNSQEYTHTTLPPPQISEHSIPRRCY